MPKRKTLPIFLCVLPSLAILTYPTTPTLAYGRHSASEPCQKHKRVLHLLLMQKKIDSFQGFGKMKLKILGGNCHVF